MKNSIFGFSFAGAVVGWFIGLVLGVTNVPKDGFLYYLAGSIGLSGIFGCFCGSVVGVLHPAIPDAMHVRALFTRMIQRLSPRPLDGLQVRTQTVAFLWVAFGAVVLLIPYLAGGYDLLLRRLQSPELAAIASSFLGLAGFASVLALGAPARTAVARSLEFLVRRRPHFSFLVHPSGNLAMTFLVGAFIYLVSSPTPQFDARTDGVQISQVDKSASTAQVKQAQTRQQVAGFVEGPNRSPIGALMRFLAISLVALMLTTLLGETFRNGFIRVPWRRGIQLLLVCLFFSGACALAGLRAPVARDALASGYSFSRIVVGALRLPFDHDDDGYSSVLGGGDCNDDDAEINPAAVEIYGNPIDENCDGRAPQVSETPIDSIQPTPSARTFGFRTPYSIVIVSVDGLRPDRLGFFGYRRQTTPALDDLAAESVVFKRAYATSSVMQMSLATIFSGRYPSELKSDKKYFPRLDDKNILLAEELSLRGYHTAGFPSHWYFGVQSGFEQGFNIWQPYVVEKGRQDVVPTAETVVTSAVEHLLRLEPDPNRPYFMWLHLLDPLPNYLDHLDIPRFGTSQTDRYDHEVRYVDTWLKWFIETLKAREDWKRTVLVLVGTRGEDFSGTTPAGMTEGNLRVPLIIRVPGLPARPVNQPISLIDLMPTLLELAGFETANIEAMQPPFKGRSLIPAFVGKSLGQMPIYAEILPTSKSSLRLSWLKGNLKVHFDGPNNRWSLFDISRDPLEQSDLAGQRRATTRSLQTELKGFRSNFDFEGKGAFP